MTVTAHTVKKGDHVFEKGQILKILDKKELHSNKHTASYKVLVSNCENNHHSTRHWAHEQVLRAVEPEHLHYKIECLGDYYERVDRLYLNLISTKDLSVREDLFVTDPGLISYLQQHFSASDTELEELDLHVLKFVVEPAHRTEKLIEMEQITGVTGYDMTHAHDHHHGHHHGHGHGQV